MTAQLAPSPVFRSWDNLGFPLVGGQLFTYAAGTSTPQATYVDSTQTTQNTNPVILNFRGECFLWLNPLLSYKFVLQDALGNLIWSEDNIQGAIGVSSNIVPSTTNTFTLGTPTISFANGYFGPNAVPVFDPVSGNIGYYARTAAEIAASVTPVNYAYAPYDLRRYGADPTGVVPSDTAMGSAISVCNVGGVIRAPAGTYLFNNPIVITGKSGITIEGDGCETIVAGAGTVFKYTGATSTNFIQISGGCFGCGIRRLQIENTSSAYTGSMLEDAASNYTFTEKVTFNITAGSGTHLNLDTAVNFYATECAFVNGSSSVLGQSASGTSFSNVVVFNRCAWASQSSTPIIYGGNDWVFRDCTWESLANGKAGAFSNQSATTPQLGITFDGCWFGDVTSGGNTWITCIGEAFNFRGNYIAGEATATSAIALQCAGIDIRGNFFNVLNIGVNFGVGACSGVVMQGNYFSAVTNQIANGANAPTNSLINPNSPNIPGNSRFFSLAANGYEWSPNGKMDQWFVASVSNGANAVSFPIAFPTACFNVTATLGTHQVGTATCYVSALTATGFTLTVVDNAGTDTAYIRAVGN
jgi:hypothetical protein